MNAAPLLSIQNLQIHFHLGGNGEASKSVQAVGSPHQGVSFDVAADRTVALVGESGSGKTVTSMSIVRLLPPNARFSGQILFEGQDLLLATSAQLQQVRGRRIACVFQDPMSSLNPVLTIGEQILEPLQWHLKLSTRAARQRALDLLDEVGLPEPAYKLRAYPHQLSGGQQQRVMIAMALSAEPKLLIADEPTTALDVTIQRQIMELLQRLKVQRRMSLLFISHDLGVVGEVADEVVVMRHGQVVEQGPVAQIFISPQAPYTRDLLACRPQLQQLPQRLNVVGHQAEALPPSAAFEDAGQPAGSSLEAPLLLDVKNLSKTFWVRRNGWRRQPFNAVNQVSFSLRRGQTLGIVGESGSGKTTLGLMLLRLHEASGGQEEGEIWFANQNLMQLSAAQMLPLRRRIQVVFQNPYASLNPRHTIGQAIREPMQVHGLLSGAARQQEVAAAMLAKVGLDTSSLAKYPHEFSGGQRQRIAIARCLVLNPEILVLDEAVSALDVSVQAQVLNLLKDLQQELGLSYVFISHDLAVVRFMADQILVMRQGCVVEQGPSEDIWRQPQQPYTQQLLAALPKGYLAHAA
jgi:peptide/nickel transport system ATP-binding protein